MEAIKKKTIASDAPIETSIRQRTEYLHNCTEITLQAPAKINISLVVQDKRPDGYHELHTVMARISLYDQLQFSRSDKPGIHLKCTGRSVSADSENLVYRAAELLAREGHIQPAITVHLHKEIPIGAGLGGGSSDAATTLKGLNQLWHLGLGQERLGELAGRLGSDVAFFLQDAIAICTGRGEIIQPIPHTCGHTVLLIIPDISISTHDVYQRHQSNAEHHEELMRCVRYFLRKGDIDGLLCQGINNLAQTCLECYGELSDLRGRIESLGIGPVYVSGSGSCMFANSTEAETIEQWADQIRASQLAEVKIVNFLNPNDAFVEDHHANL